MMYYNPINKRVFWYLGKNHYIVLRDTLLRPEHITTELRNKWEADTNVVRLSSGILGDWNEM